MIRTIYRATDGTEHASRAEAQRYERAIEFLAWLVDQMPDDFFPGAQHEQTRKDLAICIAERWYLLDRQAKRKRGQPAFTGATCPACGGRLEAIAGLEVCATCQTQLATDLRAKEMEHA